MWRVAPMVERGLYKAEVVSSNLTTPIPGAKYRDLSGSHLWDCVDKSYFVQRVQPGLDSLIDFVHPTIFLATWLTGEVPGCRGE